MNETTFNKAGVGNIWKSSQLYHETSKEATPLHPLLPVFASAHVLSRLFSLFLLSPICTKDSQRDENGCRESCSDANCSVSAQLRPADGVVTIVELLFQQPISS